MNLRQAYLRKDQASGRLQRGDRLHMELREGTRQWWFESPYALVSENVVGSLVFGHGASVRMIEAGDSLFGLPMNSQTWLPVQGGEQ